MKKYLLNPHITLMGVFILIVMASSPSVKAQVERKIVKSIIISNGDTIINGKKLSKVSNEERVRLRKELTEMDLELNASSEKRKNNKEPLILRWEDEPNKEAEIDPKNEKKGDVRIFNFNGENMNIDSLLNGLDSNLRQRGITIYRNFGEKYPGMRLLPNPEKPAFKATKTEGSKNTSSFTYNYIDQDGIPSKMDIRISDIEKDYLEKITGSKNAITDLKVEDLILFPNFSNGKIGISFNLSSKSALKIKILNSDFKQVFSDDENNFNGNFAKQITLAKNGVYYIAIKQNNSWFVQKVIKS